MFLELRGQKPHRIHIDHPILFDYVGKIDRLAINQDQVHFRMWDAARLDHIFDRCSFAQASRDSSATLS